MWIKPFALFAPRMRVMRYVSERRLQTPNLVAHYKKELCVLLQVWQYFSHQHHKLPFKRLKSRLLCRTPSARTSPSPCFTGGAPQPLPSHWRCRKPLTRSLRQQCSSLSERFKIITDALYSQGNHSCTAMFLRFMIPDHAAVPLPHTPLLQMASTAHPQMHSKQSINRM